MTVATLERSAGRTALDPRIHILRRTNDGFGIDVDNVLAASAKLFAQLITIDRRLHPPADEQRFDKRPFHLSENLQQHNIPDTVVSHYLDHEVWGVKDGVKRYLSIELIDSEAPKVLARMRDMGFRLEVMTTMGARLDQETRERVMKEWLGYHEVPYHRVSFFNSSNAKVEFMVKERILTIVDDEQKLAQTLAIERQMPGLVYDAAWNRAFVAEHMANPNRDSLIIPVKTWSEVEAFAESLRG